MRVKGTKGALGQLGTAHRPAPTRPQVWGDRPRAAADVAPGQLLGQST